MVEQQKQRHTVWLLLEFALVWFDCVVRQRCISQTGESPATIIRPSRLLQHKHHLPGVRGEFCGELRVYTTCFFVSLIAACCYSCHHTRQATCLAYPSVFSRINNIKDTAGWLNLGPAVPWHMLASFYSRVSLCMSSVVVPAEIQIWPMDTAAARRTWIRIPGRVPSYPMIINENRRHNRKNNVNQTTSRRRGRFINLHSLFFCYNVGTPSMTESWWGTG